MSIDVFGTLSDGREVHRLTLGSARGVELNVLTLGATVHRLHVTGGDGVRRNVALGRPTAEDYLTTSGYLGGTIGRYANRIAGGRFELDGRTIQVDADDRGNSLHGGPDGFDRRLWAVEEHDDAHATLALTSPDGDQGFPGTVRARVRFDVTDDRVRVRLSATTDATTVVNLTSHAYFNLDGEGAGTVDDHELEVRADEFTPTDDVGIPEGRLAPVDGTALDLRTPTRLRDALGSNDPQLAAAGGIDHNLVIRGTGLRTAAVLASRRTATRLELRTDQPGLQVYTGQHLDPDQPSTGGASYEPRGGIALEPQLFPDSPRHPEWPSARLDPGQTYRAELSWTFSALAP